MYCFCVEFEAAELGAISEIENSLALFCMATYGEGDPTDNAQIMYDFLQEGECDLAGLNYAVSLLKIWLEFLFKFIVR